MLLQRTKELHLHPVSEYCCGWTEVSNAPPRLVRDSPKLIANSALKNAVVDENISQKRLESASSIAGQADPAGTKAVLRYQRQSNVCEARNSV